jgi:hypothetical protein
MRSASENIDLMTTILSRFDLIFIVRDIRDEERDKAIARHVMGVHVDAGANNEVNTHEAIDVANAAGEEDDETVAEKAEKIAQEGGMLDIQTFKKFVQYVAAPPKTEPAAGGDVGSPPGSPRFCPLLPQSSSCTSRALYPLSPRKPNVLCSRLAAPR